MKTVTDILNDPDTLTTTLIILAVDCYGTELFEWSPETLVMSLEEDFGAKLHPLTRDRLGAGMAVVGTDLFYTSLPEHIEIANVLSGSPVTNEFDPSDAYEEAWAIVEAALLSPPETDEPFTDEIRRYIGYVTREAGIVNPPDVLKLGIGNDSLMAVDANEDPEMFSAVYQVQAAKTGEIEQMIHDMLELLLLQIEELPLKNGDPKKVVKSLRQALASHGLQQT